MQTTVTEPSVTQPEYVDLDYPKSERRIKLFLNPNQGPSFIPNHIKQLDASNCEGLLLKEGVIPPGLVCLYIAAIDAKMCIPETVTSLFIKDYDGVTPLPKTGNVFVHTYQGSFSYEFRGILHHAFGKGFGIIGGYAPVPNPLWYKRHITRVAYHDLKHTTEQLPTCDDSQRHNQASRTGDANVEANLLKAEITYLKAMNASNNHKIKVARAKLDALRTPNV